VERAKLPLADTQCLFEFYEQTAMTLPFACRAPELSILI